MQLWNRVFCTKRWSFFYFEIFGFFSLQARWLIFPRWNPSGKMNWAGNWIWNISSLLAFLGFLWTHAEWKNHGARKFPDKMMNNAVKITSCASYFSPQGKLLFSSFCRKLWSNFVRKSIKRDVRASISMGIQLFSKQEVPYKP